MLSQTTSVRHADPSLQVPTSSPYFSSLCSISTTPPQVQQRLEDFKAEAWGNKTAFRQCLNGIEYLDLSKHVPALRYLYPSFPRHGRIVIRQEYREAKAILDSNCPTYTQGASITGHPGIGKSLFLFYFAIDRMGRREPVVFQATTEFYVLFTEDGVLRWHGENALLSLQCKQAWALFDCTPTTGLPPDSFRCMGNTKLVIAASPNVHRLRKWIKDTGIYPYHLDIWTPQEMQDLAVILQLDVSEMLRLVSVFGPIPRTLLCIMYGELAKEELEANLPAAAQKAVQLMRDILNGATVDTSQGTEPSSIIFTRPSGKEPRYRRTIVPYIPTSTIFGHLLAEAEKAGFSKQQEFFDLLSRHSSTRGAAGSMFEKVGHTKFLQGLKTQCIWILPPDSPTSEAPSPTISTSTLDTEGVKSISIRGHLMTAEAPWYWQPSTPNYEGIDSVLAADDTIFCNLLLHQNTSVLGRAWTNCAGPYHKELSGYFSLGRMRRPSLTSHARKLIATTSPSEHAEDISPSALNT
ncbi:hypothetical protein F5I97DRAFT_1856915 [Phlebopus sp. FC_14]|nr:hypothetical protein F5I97DRAFT_1856915 [Phlebopus sp. FC_14]